MPLFSNARTLVRLLGYPDYRRYTIGNTISLIGTWMQRVTVGWLTWELTESGTWLGLMAFADLFPTLVVGVVAGAAADRWPLMRLLKITQTLGFVQAGLMALLYVTGQLDIILLFCFTMAMGVVMSFGQPARLAVISALVPRADLGPAVAMNALVFNLARFIGPACAGVLITSAGVAWAFVANALSYLVFVWALWHVTAVVHRPRRDRTGMLADIVEGFAYAGRTPGIWAILLVTVSIGMGARPVIELLPGFASGLFGSDATGLAALTSAVGVGALAGGTWMVGRAGAPRLTRTYLTSALGSGLACALFTAAPTLPVAVALAAVVGFFMVSTGIAGQTLLQLAVDDTVKGRMLSLFGLLQRGTPAIGAVLVGVLSEVLGLRAAAAIFAAGLIFIAALLVWRAPGIAAHLDTPKQRQPGA